MPPSSVGNDTVFFSCAAAAKESNIATTMGISLRIPQMYHCPGTLARIPPDIGPLSAGSCKRRKDKAFSPTVVLSPTAVVVLSFQRRSRPCDRISSTLFVSGPLVPGTQDSPSLPSPSELAQTQVSSA